MFSFSRVQLRLRGRRDYARRGGGPSREALGGAGRHVARVKRPEERAPGAGTDGMEKASRGKYAASRSLGRAKKLRRRLLQRESDR